MGNAPSQTTKDESTIAGTIIGCIIGILVILAVIIVIFKYGFTGVNLKVGLKGVSGISMTSIPWSIITPIILILMMIYYFSIAFWYKYTRGQWRSKPQSIATLTAIRNSTLSASLGSLNNSIASVTQSLSATPPTSPYSLVPTDSSAAGDQRALLNWRPLTVRLAGYLGGGGSNVALDGVFDMANGVQYALSQGARAFIFDIDYLEKAPCQPVVIFRDAGGIMRSLNTGSIADGLKALSQNAFKTNYDPVLVILYLRRVPAGPSQQKAFFGGIASSIQQGIQDTTQLLGQNSQGNFHNCRSESELFTSQIMNYQKKFILLCNYNTNQLPITPNPTDNLDFWINGRIYQDQSGVGSAVGNVTQTIPTGQVSYIEVGDVTQLLNIGRADQPKYQTGAQSVFKIAMGPPDLVLTPAQVSTLLNTLGIQCVPLDVVNLSNTEAHQKTVATSIAPETNIRSVTSLTKLAASINDADPLSFWGYAGWSWKNLQDYRPSSKTEGFEDTPAPILPPGPIPGFVIPKPLAPKKPAASLNSNGGMISIN
jgi:hypothetical protein